MVTTDPWNIENYVQKYPGSGQPMTMRDAKRIFQLDPEPPAVEHENEYILRAQQQPNRDAFCFFLHHYEKRLNKRIRNITVGDAELRYNPERFMEIKMFCVQKMLELLPVYDPSHGASFVTYIYEHLHDAVREFWMGEEAYSIDSPDIYRKIRHAGYVRSQCPDLESAILRFMVETGCTRPTAAKYMDGAALIRNRVSLWLTDEETGQETCDTIVAAPVPEEPPTSIRGIPVKVIRKAFWSLKLDRDRELIEARLAIRMKDGEVLSLKHQITFDELATRYGLTGPSSIRNAFEKALQRLAELLWQDGWIRAVKYNRVSKTKTAAVYQYQADCDGEWGEIEFDFKNSTATIRSLADWDSTESHRYAHEVIRRFLDSDEKHRKSGTFYFPWTT